jgi:drug/metabolite transporter (DMT)-like permease
MDNHVKGLAITTLGVLFVVPDSLFIRLIAADAPTIIFFRGLVSGTLVGLGVLAVQGTRGFRACLNTGWPGLIYTLLFACAVPGFVLAVTLTSVANVVFIIAAMPVFASLFSRVFLGEPISRRMVLTMAGVFAGMGIIAYGSGETAHASWQGDLVALGVAAAFAGAMTSVRKVRATSMIPAVPVAMIGTALIMWPFAEPAAAFAAQWPLLLAHGAVMSISTSLMTLGPRYITSAEVGLLILLESVLAPLLVWAVVGEDPGPWALVGGAVVIGVLFVSNLVLLWRRRPPRTPPQPRVGPAP